MPITQSRARTLLNWPPGQLEVVARTIVRRMESTLNSSAPAVTLPPPLVVLAAPGHPVHPVMSTLLTFPPPAAAPTTVSQPGAHDGTVNVLVNMPPLPAAPVISAHAHDLQSKANAIARLATIQKELWNLHKDVARPSRADMLTFLAQWADHERSVAHAAMWRVHSTERATCCQGCGESKRGHRRGFIHSRCPRELCWCGVPRLLHPAPLPGGAQCKGEWRAIVTNMGPRPAGLGRACLLAEECRLEDDA